MPAKDKPLTPMQKLFCHNYVADPDFNATRAAIASGFSAKSAKVKACQLLQQPNIQAEIDRLSKGVLYRLGVTTIGVVSEARNLAFSNILDYTKLGEDGNPILTNGQLVIDLSNTTRGQMSAVQELTTTTWEEGEGKDKVMHVRTKLKLHPKLPAIEALGRRLNAFPNKLEVGGRNGGAITFKLERIGGIKKPAESATA